MSIVSKKGDGGKTRLYSGQEVSKDDSRLEVYGTLDELVSFMGLARSLCRISEVSKDIHSYQEILFRLGTELATANSVAHTGLLRRSTPRNNEQAGQSIGVKDVQRIDDLIVAYEEKIDLPKKFVIPGSNSSSATLDVCRTVCRRLERLMVGFSKSGEWKNPNALIFVNRLSDLLFLMARRLEKS